MYIRDPLLFLTTAGTSTDTSPTVVLLDVVLSGALCWLCVIAAILSLSWNLARGVFNLRLHGNEQPTVASARLFNDSSWLALLSVLSPLVDGTYSSPLSWLDSLIFSDPTEIF